MIITDTIEYNIGSDSVYSSWCDSHGPIILSVKEFCITIMHSSQGYQHRIQSVKSGRHQWGTNKPRNRDRKRTDSGHNKSEWKSEKEAQTRKTFEVADILSHCDAIGVCLGYSTLLATHHTSLHPSRQSEPNIITACMHYHTVKSTNSYRLVQYTKRIIIDERKGFFSPFYYLWRNEANLA